MADYEDEVISDLEEEQEEEYQVKKSKKKRRKQYDEEEEEEEDDRRSSKRNRALQFFETEAQEDDDDEAYEEDFEDDGDREFIAGEEEMLPDELPNYNRANRPPPRLTGVDEMEDVEDLEAMVRQRYSGMHMGPVDQDDLNHQQETLLPTKQDPKLWLVHIKPGHEKEAVVQLIQKVVNLAEKGQFLQIYSAFCREDLPNYIYVEAYKESAVRDAARGLRSVIQSKEIKNVPQNEMVQTLTITRSSKAQFSVGNLVRIKHGIYKDDLAEIIDLEPGKATVKITPRIDYKPRGERGKSNFGRQQIRPQPKAFSEEEARAHDMLVELKYMRYLEEGEGYGYVLNHSRKFQDGYEIKVFPLRNLIAETSPPFEEVQQFRNISQSGAGQDVGGDQIGSGMGERDGFNKGDEVEVIGGDLKGLKGVVEGILENGRVQLSPMNFKELEGQYVKVHLSEIQKHLQEGTQVKVISGQHKGERGMVINVSGHVARIMSDTKQCPLEVLVKDVTTKFEHINAASSLGPYTIHSFVILTDKSAGMIVEITADVAHVVSNAEESEAVKNVTQQEIVRSIGTHTLSSKDCNGAMIRSGDVVTVQEGRFNGRTGTIKHIFKGHVWIHSREVMKNGGIIVVRGQGVKSKAATAPRPELASPAMVTPGSSYGPQSPARMGLGQSPSSSSFSVLSSPSREAASSSQFQHMGRGGFSGRKDHAVVDKSLVDKEVTIASGRYRGYKGRIKHATTTHVRVELQASNQTVMIERKFLPNEGFSGEGRRGGRGREGGRGERGRGRSRGRFDRNNRDNFREPEPMFREPRMQPKTPMHPGMPRSPTQSPGTPFHGGSNNSDYGSVRSPGVVHSPGRILSPGFNPDMGINEPPVFNQQNQGSFRDSGPGYRDRDQNQGFREPPNRYDRWKDRESNRYGDYKDQDRNRNNYRREDRFRNQGDFRNSGGIRSPGAINSPGPIRSPTPAVVHSPGGIRSPTYNPGIKSPDYNNTTSYNNPPPAPAYGGVIRSPYQGVDTPAFSPNIDARTPAITTPNEDVQMGVGNINSPIQDTISPYVQGIHNPTTPGFTATPNTQGDDMDYGENSLQVEHLKDVCLEVENQKAMVIGVDNDNVQVELGSVDVEGQFVSSGTFKSLPVQQELLTVPRNKEYVRILGGKEKVGSIGQLIGVDQEDGIVQIPGGDIIITPLNILGKFADQKQAQYEVERLQQEQQ